MREIFCASWNPVSLPSLLGRAHLHFSELPNFRAHRAMVLLAVNLPLLGGATDDKCGYVEDSSAWTRRLMKRSEDQSSFHKMSKTKLFWKRVSRVDNGPTILLNVCESVQPSVRLCLRSSDSPSSSSTSSRGGSLRSDPQERESTARWLSG